MSLLFPALVMSSLLQCIAFLMPLLDSTIPNTVERLALNIRSQETDQRFQPIEIQLERTSSDSSWQLRFIATFDVVVTATPQKELSLYFNFAGCWFYHPEIKQCSLQRPEVQTLLASWLNTRSSHTLQSPSTFPHSLISISLKEVTMNQAANLAMFVCKRVKPSHQLKDLIKRSIHDVNYRGRLTIRFKDTSYHPKEGRLHPVSITIDMKDSHIAISEITDRVYVGDEIPELVPDLIFDFANNVAFARFSGWLGMHLQETTELYEMWECNFLAYVAMDAYNQIQIKCG